VSVADLNSGRINLYQYLQHDCLGVMKHLTFWLHAGWFHLSLDVKPAPSSSNPTALPRYPKGRYDKDQNQTIKDKAGVWQGEFIEPWLYREK